LLICNWKYKVKDAFAFIFQAAKRAGWLPADNNTYPKANHVGFGLVLGEDGKRFRTRDTEVVPLVDLLDEAKSRSKAALIDRGMVVNNMFFLSNVVSLSLSCFRNHVYGISFILQL
jgi:arginyl-tRNA synthetase